MIGGGASGTALICIQPCTSTLGLTSSISCSYYSSNPRSKPSRAQKPLGIVELSTSTSLTQRTSTFVPPPTQYTAKEPPHPTLNKSSKTYLITRLPLQQHLLPHRCNPTVVPYANDLPVDMAIMLPVLAVLVVAVLREINDVVCAGIVVVVVVALGGGGGGGSGAFGWGV